jgi:hypothetical protein
VSVEYTLTDARLRSLKAAVTRAQKKQDWWGVITACNKALTVFQHHGYPDCWADFERHASDAGSQLQMQKLLLDKGCW